MKGVSSFHDVRLDLIAKWTAAALLALGLISTLAAAPHHDNLYEAPAVTLHP
ncbi:MAG: hypothetical protein KGL46_08320 [Hyphomicrobiales bacterium]|nr:hypothetical protein [Hyphomicrobiales bacterium]